MSLLNHITGILLKPKNEWPVIKQESINVNQLFTGYVAILALIPAIASFINLIGHTFKYGIIYAVVSYIFALVGVYVSAFIINALAPKFESKSNMNNALKLVAFSETPVWIAGIFSIFPPLAVIGSIVSLYALYLLYIGLEPMMETPAHKRTVFFLVTLVVMAVILMVIGGAIVGIVAFRLMY